MIQDNAASTEKRADMLHRLSELGDRASVETMLELSFDAAQPVVLRLAALNALKRLEHPDIPRRLLTHWSILEVRLQSTAMAVLTGRMPWTLQTLRAVQAGHLPKEDVPYEVLVRLSEQGGQRSANLDPGDLGTNATTGGNQATAYAGSGKDPSGDRWACRCR